MKNKHWLWMGWLIAAPMFAAQPFDYKFEGEARLWGIGYRPDAAPNPDVFFEASVRPRLTLFFSDQWLFHGTGVARWDSESYATGALDTWVEDDRRYALNLPESYVEFSRHQWRARLGKQLFDWSITDLVSPTDSLNARDWTDILEWERVGAPAFNLRYGQDAYVEAVVCAFTPSKLPSQRWLPVLPAGVALANADSSARGEPQGAVRGAMLVRGFELGASAFYGYGYGPSLEVMPVSSNVAHLVPTYRRQEVVTAFLTGEIFEHLILRTEAGFFRQDREDDFVQTVIGLERHWTGVFGGTDQLRGTLQYAHEFETENVRSRLFQRLDLRRAFDQTAFGQVQYAFNDRERWALRLRGAYSFKDHGSWLQPAVVWSQHEFEAAAGFDFMAGPSRSFWGSFGGQDRLFIKLSYFF